jgi:HSP20 family molecular chaperone IbpA
MTTTLAIHRPSLLGRNVFEDIFDSMLDFPQLMQKTTQGYPVADIFREENGDTVIEFALAGFRKEDLSVEIKPETKSITVTGNIDNTKRPPGRHRVARRSFTKTYVNYDNNLDLNKISASFENGLLRLVVPTRPAAQIFKVDIE